MKNKSGFSLAEVLIALALLGVVAAFTIPQILHSQTQAKYKTLTLETMAATQNVVYAGNLNNQMFSSTTLTDYLASKLNAIKVCKTNFQTEGYFLSS